MKPVLRHILLTLLMLAFIQLPAAAGQSMPNVVTKWNGHNLSLTLPESFVATEESDKEIVFADETGQFSLCLREVNHNEYASLGASQIEGILCSHLCKHKVHLENSYAQTRQTSDFRIRSVLAPNPTIPHLLLVALALLAKNARLLY